MQLKKESVNWKMDMRIKYQKMPGKGIQIVAERGRNMKEILSYKDKDEKLRNSPNENSPRKEMQY